MSAPQPIPDPIRVKNPATGEIIREIPCADPAAIDAAVARARAAQPAWGALSFGERARALRRFARALRDDDELMATLVAENGKTRYEAELFELFYVLELTRYYTGRAGRRALADELHHPLIFANKRTRVVRHPRGVVGVIGPWNFPMLNNYGDCIGPLAAGNAVVLKPSDTTPLTSLRVGALWKSSGLPDGVLEVVAGRGDAGAALTATADMIFFTGSPTVGKQVAATAAARLIPAVLELGGKSAMIVLADADLPRAARAAVWSGFAGSGQVCIRTERVLVEAPAADRLLALMTEEIGRLRQAAPGRDGADEVTVDVGAITFAPQIARAESQIADAVARGARLLTGGARRNDLGAGQFFPPTLIADATLEMAVMREETFGPLLPVMRVASAEEALRIANDSPFGLSGSVWSADVDRARALARRVATGSLCVNDALFNYFCVEAPLGGIKASGFGFRHGAEGLRQFCRIETIVEDHPLLGWLSPFVARQLSFPYQARTKRLLRRFMRLFY
ncbi:MAG TPA: aldehyde dehydrogenase family protein [Polyangia bacterium]|nr:aldehyde dehydrogenase family protein [Polyangia bacterium]